MVVAHTVNLRTEEQRQAKFEAGLVHRTARGTLRNPVLSPDSQIKTRDWWGGEFSSGTRPDDAGEAASSPRHFLSITPG